MNAGSRVVVVASYVHPTSDQRVHLEGLVGTVTRTQGGWALVAIPLWGHEVTPIPLACLVPDPGTWADRLSLIERLTVTRRWESTK